VIRYVAVKERGKVTNSEGNVRSSHDSNVHEAAH